MSRRALAAAVACALLAPAARGAEPPRWSVADQARMAAAAVSLAPPDFKRQLAKHSRRLMQGVSDSSAADTVARDAAAHRAAAARGARALGEAIRRHTAFEDVAYQAGAIVHELALAFPPQGPPPAAAPNAARFLGYTEEPFAAPETLVAAPLPAATAQERYDAALTLSTRLLAWVWKTAGGDASIVKQYPAAKGPYAP